MLWVSALASAFIDNIPFNTALIPVIKTIANDPIVQDGDLQMHADRCERKRGHGRAGRTGGDLNLV